MVRKKEFATTYLGPDNKNFLVYITSFINFNLSLEIHLFYKIQIVFLKIYKSPISVFSKYANFENIFSKNLVVKLSKHIKINNYIIKFVKSK